MIKQMIQINPDRIITVELTPKEQKTLVRYCESIGRDIYRKILDAKNGVLILLVEECQYLRQYVGLMTEDIDRPKVQDILGKIFNKLSTNPVIRDLSEELSGQDFDSIEDMNEAAQQIMVNRNARPDPELGNLSPNQVSKLINLPWNDSKFPIKFNQQLKISDLKQSTFLTNATIFLQTLLELKDQDTATAKRNLNRKLVKAVFDKLLIDSDIKEDILKYNKVINEEDVFPLHVIRIVCEEAKLIQCRKKKFIVTTRGKKLLSEENMGELFYKLFITYFRKFNIAYVDRFPALDSVQQTLGYSLCRLSQITDRFVDMVVLFEEIFLPAVKKEIREVLPKVTFVEWFVESRIVRPLREFGLLECRYSKEENREIESLRKTGLFDKYMRVEW
jgi:hypothetical protein